MARKPKFEAEEADEIQQEAVEQAAPPVVMPPGITLAQAFEQLKEAENLPESTNGGRREKALRLALARKVCAELQQGLPVLEIGADEYARSHSSKSQDLRLTRLSMIARTNLDVSWLLTEYRKLTDQ